MHCEERSNLTPLGIYNTTCIAKNEATSSYKLIKTRALRGTKQPHVTLKNMENPGYVYIMSSPNRTTLYVGSTLDLRGRIWKHRTKFYPNSFSAKYNCVMLVYYCNSASLQSAQTEEKRLKAGSRKQKDELIMSMNPEWVDLRERIY